MCIIKVNIKFRIGIVSGKIWGRWEMGSWGCTQEGSVILVSDTFMGGGYLYFLYFSKNQNLSSGNMKNSFLPNSCTTI